MNFDETFDFDGPLPPDIPDGEYRAVLKEIEEGQTKAQKPMFRLHFVTSTAAGDDKSGEGKMCTFFFMPKDREGNKYFRMFAQEVKDLFAAFGRKPPSMPTAEMGTADAWRPHLQTLLDGGEVTLNCSNEPRKDAPGTNLRVKFPRA